MTDESRDPGMQQNAADDHAAPGQAVTGADDTAAPQPISAADEKRGGALRWLLETVAMVALAFLLAQGIKTYVLQPFVVPTGSMESTIMTGDRVLSEKISLLLRRPAAR